MHERNPNETSYEPGLDVLREIATHQDDLARLRELWGPTEDWEGTQIRLSLPGIGEQEETTPGKPHKVWPAYAAAAVITASVTGLFIYNVIEDKIENETVAITSAPTPCRVSAVSEDVSTGTATVRFAAPIEGKTIEIVELDNGRQTSPPQTAEPIGSSPTEFEFSSRGMHFVRLGTQVDGANCASGFSLGSPRSGDETLG